MLTAPKGYKYWINGNHGTELSSDAPDWAVEEFRSYQKMMSNSGISDDNGVAIHY